MIWVGIGWSLKSIPTQTILGFILSLSQRAKEDSHVSLCIYLFLETPEHIKEEAAQPLERFAVQVLKFILSNEVISSSF